jgi:hypothetical protein
MNKSLIIGREDLKRDNTTSALLACDKGKLMEARRLKKENDRYINLEKRIQELELLVQSLLKGK